MLRILDKLVKRGPKDVPGQPVVEQQQLPEEAARSSEAYLRLKNRLGDKRDFSEIGLKPDSLTFGEFVDACALYVQNVVGGLDMAQNTLNRLAGKLLPETMSDEAESLIFNSLHNQKDTIDPESPIYNQDISLVMPQTHPKYIDITHYPGGLSFDRLPGTNKFRFRLDNRQQSDNGKSFIKDLYEEVGLPIQSNISQ